MKDMSKSWSTVLVENLMREKNKPEEIRYFFTSTHVIFLTVGCLTDPHHLPVVDPHEYSSVNLIGTAKTFVKTCWKCMNRFRLYIWPKVKRISVYQNNEVTTSSTPCCCVMGCVPQWPWESYQQCKLLVWLLMLDKSKDRGQNDIDYLFPELKMGFHRVNIIT